MPLSVGMEELKKNIKEGAVKSVQRKMTKDGVKSGTVLVEFEGSIVSNKVFLGFMSYPVRMYVPMLLRCFNCQRFGHIASL